MLGKYDFQPIDKFRATPPSKLEVQVVYDFLNQDISAREANDALNGSHGMIYPTTYRVMRWWYQQGILTFNEPITNVDQLLVRSIDAENDNNN